MFFATSLDDFLEGDKVMLIKMDSLGDIIPEALMGTKKTIDRFYPKLVLGAYYSFEAIFDVCRTLFIVNGLTINSTLAIIHGPFLKRICMRLDKRCHF